MGCATALAAWVLHLRGHGAPVVDAGADAARSAAVGDLGAAVPAVLDTLEPGLGDDDALVALVRERAALLVPGS